MSAPPRGLEVEPEAVRALLDAGEDLVLIDCRTPEEHARASIEGAIPVPLDEVRDRLGELDELEGRRVVVFCHHGVRSLRAAAFLREHGVCEALSMAGGIDAWSRRIDPRVPRY